MFNALKPFELDLDGFTSYTYPDDRHGWGSDGAIFRDLITRLRPELIIEVGTWKGGSALHMADICAELDLPTRILCIDTWLGAAEFWTDLSDPERYQSLKRVYGYPSVYYQFLSNVKRAGHEDRILAFPQTSLIAGRLLRSWGVSAAMVYIDGSHDYEDVFADMRVYWPLVCTGGVLFGDDYGTWADVQRAADAFGCVPVPNDRRYWIWQK